MVALIITLAPVYLIAAIGYCATVYIDKLFGDLDE